MQPQKFIAATMKDGLRQVREALGDDAMILRSERVKPTGVLSFARQNMIEITAAPHGYVADDDVNGPEFAKTLEDAGRPPVARPSSPVAATEMDRLRDEVSRLTGQLDEIGKYFKYNRLPVMPGLLTKMWETMSNSGMNRDWATDIAQEALISLGQDDLNSAQRIEQFVIEHVAAQVRPAPPMTARRRTATKIMLVGMPGAGKTTLLQKLASDPAACGKRRIGLLSLDTHRVAAIDQLKAFSRISGAPLEVVYRADQVHDALLRMTSSEFILIDTPGISHRDTPRLRELRELMDAIDPDEVHHVLNAMLRDDEMDYVIGAYRDLGITHLSFTRMDEVHRFGYLLNVAKNAGKPIGWLTKGQAFVGHLERFTPAHLKQWTQTQADVDSGTETSHILMRMD